MTINFQKTFLPHVFIITPKRFEDDRGFFEETWNASSLKNYGIETSFVQDNHSYSREIGTLRGLHYQFPPYAQDKLVRCTQGSILDVAVDIRKKSPTYGKWIGVKLSRNNGKQLLIPKGFLHGFVTLSENTEVQYKCSNIYSPENDGCILWNSLNIDWGLSNNFIPILSNKDKSAQAFENFISPFEWEGDT